ncbi:globin domain-containing protein [Frigidibacter sp. MR17.24]|uniref:globin domain-containing protein n=1 Tax=Frigidibacter sp. MR17.24 TaxID=3127345 RepID=UPI003012A376
MFSSEDIEAVRSSFAAALEREPELILLFYERLFRANPHLRSLFPRTMKDQAHKLHLTLDIAMAGLRKPQALESPLRAHGRRHAAMGVRSPDYQLVETVLVEVLAELAGPDWTPAAAAGWDRLLGFVSATMIAGATEERARPAFPGVPQPMRPAG